MAATARCGPRGADGALLPLTLAQPSRDAHAHTAGARRDRSGGTSFVFDGVDAGPMPSLLRDFSAPVVDRLSVLRRHRARFPGRARQRSVQPLGGSPAAGGRRRAARSLDGADAAAARRAPLRRRAGDAYAAATTTLDPAFRELLLTLPSEGVIAEQLAVVDPAACARRATRCARASPVRWPHSWARAVRRVARRRARTRRTGRRRPSRAEEHGARLLGRDRRRRRSTRRSGSSTPPTT